MTELNSRATLVREHYGGGDFLGIAEVILPFERMGAEVGRSCATWDSRSFNHFKTPIALEDATFSGKLGEESIRVDEVNFHIFGEDEMELLVNKSNLGFVRSDPLSRDVISTFVEAYTNHLHLICLRALRSRREEQVANVRTKQTDQRNESRKSFRVTLNGMVQLEL
jgi:hypothetical protein